jgi:hypothetical protein
MVGAEAVGLEKMAPVGVDDQLYVGAGEPVEELPGITDAVGPVRQSVGGIEKAEFGVTVPVIPAPLYFHMFV